MYPNCFFRCIFKAHPLRHNNSNMGVIDEDEIVITTKVNDPMVQLDDLPEMEVGDEPIVNTPISSTQIPTSFYKGFIGEDGNDKNNGDNSDSGDSGDENNDNSKNFNSFVCEV